MYTKKEHNAATKFLCIEFYVKEHIIDMRKVNLRLTVTPDPLDLDSATVQLVGGDVSVQLKDGTHIAIMTLKDTVNKAKKNLLPFTVSDYLLNVCWDKECNLPVHHRETLIIYKDKIPKAMLFFMRGHIRQKFNVMARCYASALALSFKKVQRDLGFSKHSFFQILKKCDRFSQEELAAAEALLSLSRQ